MVVYKYCVFLTHTQRKQVDTGKTSLHLQIISFEIIFTISKSLKKLAEDGEKILFKKTLGLNPWTAPPVGRLLNIHFVHKIRPHDRAKYEKFSLIAKEVI